MLQKICLFILTCLCTLSLHAQVEYDIIPLLPADHIPTPGKFFQTFPRDMSRTGFVVGSWAEFEDSVDSDPIMGGFVYHQLLGYQKIEIPGVTRVHPEKVNIHGVVAGTCYTKEKCYFIYDSVNKTVEYLQSAYSIGSDLDEYEIFAITQDSRLFLMPLWDDSPWNVDVDPPADQKVVKLPYDTVSFNNNADVITKLEFIPRFGERQRFGSLDPYGRFEVTAQVLSDHGVVAGHGLGLNREELGFIWDADKGLRSFPNLGGEFVYVQAINNHSQVIGTATNARDRFRAFFYDEESGLINLGTLKGHNFSQANDINDQSIVVGVSTIEDHDEKDRAFVWDKQHGMRDLSALHSGGSEWKCLETAEKLTPEGHIMGLGVFRGEWCAYLLIPCDK